jgi:hypothetical protein
MSLFEDIRRCPGDDCCWGRWSPAAYGPVAVPCRARQPKVMVITEQPNLARKNASEPWNTSERMTDYLKQSKRGLPGIAERIDGMLGGALFSDFNEQDGRFTDFYWTHFIKCPGQLRQKRKFGGRGRLREGACADRWLLAEIKALKPTIILSFGAQASTWILSKARYGGKWTDWVWDEFRRIITNQEAPTADVDGFGTTLIAALHPSGANPLALSFNEKIGQLVKASLARPPRT